MNNFEDAYDLSHDGRQVTNLTTYRFISKGDRPLDCINDEDAKEIRDVLKGVGKLLAIADGRRSNMGNHKYILFIEVEGGVKVYLYTVLNGLYNEMGPYKDLDTAMSNADCYGLFEECKAVASTRVLEHFGDGEFEDEGNDDFICDDEDDDFDENEYTTPSTLNEGGYSSFTNHIGEKDSFYDPYKNEHDDNPEEIFFGSSDDEKARWRRKFFKDLDFSSIEGLKKAAAVYYNAKGSDAYNYDLSRDDYSAYLACQKVLKELYDKIAESVNQLGIKTSDIDESLYLYDIVSAVEKENSRKAAKDAEIEECKSKIVDLLGSGEYDEYIDYFDDNGDLLEKKSWGWIKDQTTDLHKLAKKIWISKWGKKF